MTRIFILWDNSYSVGNFTIDTQHQKFIAIINELYESFVDQTTAQKMENIIEELIDYSNYHFKTEEELFNKYNYPDKEVHMSKHTEFSIKIKEFQENFRKGQSNLTFQLMNFLRNWLLTHLKGEDQEYAGFIKSKEIQK
jgi:hemerythrin-like metal-binding protein